MSTISAQGTAYDLTGPESAPVLVLIHGLGMNRQITWQDYLAPFSKSYRVLSYDLCGHGESALPKTKPSLSVLSEQLYELLNELEIDTCTLIGFSLGGMINRRFAMDHPERTTAVVVMNSPHERNQDAQRLVEERAAKTESGGIEATIDSTLERWFTKEYRNDQAANVSRVRQVVLANDLENYTLHRQVLAAGVTELIKPNPPLALPCLVITCENDTGSTPAMSNAIAAEIKFSETIIMQDLQHLGLLERPDLFIGPIISFLAKHSLFD
ncbi:MAG: alpha/beta hydrolase [Pseudomonadota bacterium]